MPDDTRSLVRERKRQETGTAIAEPVNFLDPKPRSHHIRGRCFHRSMEMECLRSAIGVMSKRASGSSEIERDSASGPSWKPSSFRGRLLLPFEEKLTELLESMFAQRVNHSLCHIDRLNIAGTKTRAKNWRDLRVVEVRKLIGQSTADDGRGHLSRGPYVNL